MTAHAVDHWFDRLAPVTRAGLTAYVNRGEHASIDVDPARWTPETIRLIRTLFRPRRTDLREFLEDQGILDSSSDTPEYAAEIDAAAVTAWKTPMARLLVGAALPVARRARELFSVRLAFNSWCNSSVFSWRAAILSKELAVVTEASDDDGLTLFPCVLGVVPRRSLFASAALLLLEQKGEAEWLSEEGLFDEMSATGIPLTEVYRLLLSRCHLGGDDVLTMRANTLPQYRAPSADYAFPDIAVREAK